MSAQEKISFDPEEVKSALASMENSKFRDALHQLFAVNSNKEKSTGM